MRFLQVFESLFFLSFSFYFLREFCFVKPTLIGHFLIILISTISTTGRKTQFPAILELIQTIIRSFRNRFDRKNTTQSHYEASSFPHNERQIQDEEGFTRDFKRDLEPKYSVSVGASTFIQV